MAYMNPESRKAGRNVATIAIWVANNWERATAEMKMPSPSAPVRKHRGQGSGQADPNDTHGKACRLLKKLEMQSRREEETGACWEAPGGTRHSQGIAVVREDF